MGRVKNNIIKYIKKFTISFKRSWRKLKYLDKTQFNYFVVTGFLGLFCMFTGTTYSLFTVSKYLSAATITIAKLNYTLTSSTDGYSNGTITVDAGKTTSVDLTLTSLNPIQTKYALNYTTSNTGASVFYSQNLKNNVSGTIGTNGSSINMRIVINNTSTSAATVTFNILGGYVQNSLTTNITAGFYEQDLTIRTILLDENFGNATPAADFPLKTDSYAYFKTDCSEQANPVWNYDDWSITLNNLSEQIACDVYFKKLTNDIEVYFMLQDVNGQNGVLSDSVPNNGTYTFQNATCSTGVEATWDATNWQLAIPDISNKTMCIGYFNSNS